MQTQNIDVSTLLKVLSTQQTDPSDKYKTYLLDLWQQAGYYNTILRNNFLMGNPDGEVLINFVTTLLNLYAELDPKVKGLDVVNWDKFRVYTMDPTALLNKELNGFGEIWKLASAIREALEKLKITQVETVK